MLGRDEHIVRPERSQFATLLLLAVLENNLTLAIGPQPRQGPISAHLGHLFTNLISEIVRVRVQNHAVPLICSISKYEPLVSCSPILHWLITPDRSSDVCILADNDLCQGAVGAIQSTGFTREAHIDASLPGHRLVIDRWCLVTRACLSDQDQLHKTRKW